MGIAAIMAEVGQKVSYLQKQGDNTAQGYKYARAQDVFLKVNEEIHKRGVACIASSVSLEESVSGLGKSGNQHRVIVRIVQTYKHDETGETATFEGLGGGQDSGDKAVMKANTAALKYLLTNAFNISWGDDPEATDPETGETTAKPATKQVKEKKPKTKPSAREHKALMAEIANAADEAALEKAKEKVLALDNQTKEYQEAKQAVIDRRNALRQTTIPGT